MDSWDDLNRDVLDYIKEEELGYSDEEDEKAQS